ncbi:MAG: WXG100 family type VII secretion target [Anaerolinea sp.]|nr:WXG100 family type VII secretion target [Anaerolinea sp.]
MSNDIIQARYDGLASVANRFGSQGQSNQELLAHVRQVARLLEGGGWQGRGSSAFFAELNGEVLPAMQRLAAALHQARTVTLDIARVMRQAEEEAARPFRGGALGGAAGNAAGNDVVAAGPGAGSASTAMDTSHIFVPGYMDGLIGLQVQGADSTQLNSAMETLAGNPTPQQVQQALDQIAEARGLPREVVQAHYERYLELRSEAERIGAAKGHEASPAVNQFMHDRFMGSTTQLRYGQVVGDALGVDPVFGALLNPSGGLVGPGNAAMDLGDSALGYHGVVHDAAGYLFNYHNLGPGYDYLGREGRDTSSPLTGQQAGIQYWTQRLDSGFVESALSNTGGMLLGVAEDVKTGVSQAIDWLDDLF